jgi:maltoporin
VFNVSFNGTQTDHSVLLSYNNLTSLNEKWQLEPSLKYYTRSSSLSGDTDTWTAGVRGIYRVRSQVSVESELTYERSKNMNTTSSAGVTTTTESSRNGMTYYLGARLDF